MRRQSVVLCLPALVFLFVSCAYKPCRDPRITCWLGPFIQPARHVILPEGERELLVYDCLAFDVSDYWPETADMASTCFEFYQVTRRWSPPPPGVAIDCGRPQYDYELISYYTRNLEGRGWTKDERATVITEDSELILFQKEPYLLSLSHYEEQGIEMFSLWRSPCESDWEEHKE